MRKALTALLSILSLAYVGACGRNDVGKTIHKFVPDNDLWKEDRIEQVFDLIGESDFNKIIDLGQWLYSTTAQQYQEKLTITRRWEDPTVNASAWRDGRGNTEIIMYGGMARRPEVTPLSFALVLCHEINHLYGYEPYIEPSLRMSAETQADWFGAGWCLKNIATYLKDNSPFNKTPYMENACKGDQLCLRQLAGANGLGQLLAKLSGAAIPRFETPDTVPVKRTTLSYAKTTQCRLDSYFGGVMGMPRSRCWYRP
jgi:hypothetical protein